MSGDGYDDPGSGWQTTLTDLSLILFMVMGAAATGTTDKPQPPPPPPPPPSAPAPVMAPVKAQVPLLGDPVAVYRAGNDGPTLATWLASQSHDPRQRLTIVVPYVPGREAAALDRARAMVREADVPARIIVQPGDPASAYAALTFDMAQDLHSSP